MNTDDTLLQNQILEIRRGTTVIAALALLRTPQYGYALLEQFAEKGFDMEANTLYPLLRRLEGQGLLTAEWNTDESRPRKYYVTSEQGLEMLTQLATSWTDLNQRIVALLDQEGTS